MSPKNYTVRNLKKSDEAEVESVLKVNPLWKRKHARDLVARRNLIRRLHHACKTNRLLSQNCNERGAERAAAYADGSAFAFQHSVKLIKEMLP